METARRLGSFFLALAFILYVVFNQSTTETIAWRDQLIVYSILFGGLGLLLLVRYRARKRENSRFSGLRNFLFNSKSGKRKNKNKTKRGRRASIGDEETGT